MIKNFLKINFYSTVIICLLSLSGCNSNSKSDAVGTTDSVATTTVDSATTTTPATADSTNTTVAAPAATTDNTDENANATTHTVTINNMKFNPSILTIKKGDKVTFTNEDIVGHNATAKDKSWASPTLNTGDSWSVTPTKTVDYSCTIHPTMLAKIEVK